MKSDRVYLQHILEMIGRIERATSQGREAFLGSELHQDAVLRNLHTMTETTQRISSSLKARYTQVEWKSLAAFRNVLVHEYLGIDLELLWTVISRDVPALKANIIRMLADIS